MNAPFVTDPVRTAITLAYRNEAFIADMVLPRAPVSAEEFKWVSYNKEDRFTIPDSTVDRKGKINEVEFGGTEMAAMTNDYGLQDTIPQKDIDAGAAAGFDPQGNATELLTDLVLLGREQRAATLVHNAASYPSANKETLGASDKWSASTGDPIEQLTAAMEIPMMRPNVLQLSSAGALALRRNEKIVKAYHGNTGTDGLVPLEFIRQLFELEQIIVGRARYNAAKPGQTLSLTRLWPDNALLFYRNASAMPSMGLTFGLTAQFGSRVSQSKRDDDVGLRGATIQRVGESVKELIIANDTAYLISGVI